MKWNVTYKCVCVCVCVRACVRASVRARVRACVRARAGVCMCVCAQVCVRAFGCCFVGANGCIPLTMLVDECQCCCLLMFVCLPLSRHFPSCNTWLIKNLNPKLNLGTGERMEWNMRAWTHVPVHTDL